MMLSNAMYSPSFDEAYFYFDGKTLVILTGGISEEITVVVNFNYDPQHYIGSLADADELPVISSLIYKAIPLAVSKIKAEIGLTI